MKRVDMTNVKEAGSFNHPAGPYICVIRKVEDVPDKEYLRVTYDIAEGEYKGYYDKRRADHPDWGNVGVYIKSYKQKALPMFKRFCSAVSKSNGTFIFDGNTINADEKTLAGKKIGLVFQEEEYYSNSGDLRTRMIISSEFPIDKISNQKVPQIKRVKDDIPAQTTPADEFINLPEGDAVEIPFD